MIQKNINQDKQNIQYQYLFKINIIYKLKVIIINNP